MTAGLTTLKAEAQSASATTASEATQADQSLPTDREDLQHLLDTLRDPEQRAALEKQIETLLAVQQQQPEVVEKRGFGADLLEGFSSAYARVKDSLNQLQGAFGQSSRLWTWLNQQAADPTLRDLWIQIIVAAAISVGGGLVVAYLIDRALAGLRRRLAGRVTDSVFRRIRFSIARLVVDFVPVVAFSLIGMLCLGWIDPPERARLALLGVLYAVAASMAAMVVARWLFSPLLPQLRLIPMKDGAAAYLYIWSRRLILIIVWSYVLLQTALVLGLPAVGFIIAVKLVGLLITALLIVLVLQNRETVASAIRHTPREGETNGKHLVPGAVRARLAEIWHIIAVAYLIAAYLVWAVEISGGFVYLLRATIITLVVIALVASGEFWVPRLFNRMSGTDSAMRAHYPLVAERANRYLPILRRILVYAIRTVAVLVILAAWQLNVAGVLFSDVGRDLLGRLFDIGLAILLSLAAWEVASGLITAHLNRRDAAGISMVRSARLRTLLPLMRNALMILISVMATLIVLSEIGIDIAPLIAGAGVAGLAIGFGAQSLVKDVITGAFILFEDTINIGDVVNIDGTGGVVEGMTVRTLRLRDISGSVHTIPFGSINAVTNMTRDFSYYLLDIGVAYRENTDDVVAIMREVDSELRNDPTLGNDIIDPIEILGVDRFEDSAVIVRGRVKTRPIRQWDVGREFNRRLKMKFDERGIEMPFPHRTIYFGESKTGSAPPIHVASEKTD
ncbi:MAG: mechanosensitive ion channel [Dongiaceae bacterium]